MFERFTTDARQVVVDAQREAREAGHTWIGTEHLLLAALADHGSPVQATLAELGVTYADVKAQVVDELGGPRGAGDEEALRDLGIDLDEVRRRVEASFGPGALDDQAGRTPAGGSPGAVAPRPADTYRSPGGRGRRWSSRCVRRCGCAARRSPRRTSSWGRCGLTGSPPALSPPAA